MVAGLAFQDGLFLFQISICIMTVNLELKNDHLILNLFVMTLSGTRRMGREILDWYSKRVEMAVTHAEINFIRCSGRSLLIFFSVSDRLSR
jgi:hypothetical protein